MFFLIVIQFVFKPSKLNSMFTLQLVSNLKMMLSAAL